ncbi:hypothetical protein Y032_0042g498 [Ancylostoma ceylanicum]|uniref:Uncharacterized protein n=1 Tax=Ancylostoma ceylanicum TaxID=53326 RepID=A0A016UF12_9BILA|nr:hypothetical protein Y032_0042g498 [Ancylostoma ceylanicum]
MVCPLLEYCSMIWSPSTRSSIEQVESVQAKFTERIFARAGIFHMPYKQRLKCLGADSSELRRTLMDYDFVFKPVWKEIELDFEQLFKRSNTVI